MDRNIELTNFVSAADLTGKEYYALGTDFGLCDADGETCLGIIYQVGKNVGDVCVAAVDGETTAQVVVKAGENLNVGDYLTCSAPISIDGGANVSGLLMKYNPTVDTTTSVADEPVKGGFPFAMAMEAVTADGTNNTQHLIQIRIF